LGAQLLKTIDSYQAKPGTFRERVSAKEVTQIFFDAADGSHKYHTAAAKLLIPMIGRLFQYFLQYAQPAKQW
jgi:S-methylmethionine-dependent homocysteine/selenocysteine methylase